MARPRGSTKKTRRLNSQEIERVFSYARECARNGSKYGGRNLILLLLSLYLGLRLNEISRLKIGDVLNEEGILKKCMVLKKNNGANLRYVYLTNEYVRELLTEYLDYLGRTHLDSPLLPSQKGNDFFLPKTLRRVMAKVFQDAGIYDGTSLSCRLAFKEKLEEINIDETIILMLIGYKKKDAFQYRVIHHRKMNNAMGKINFIDFFMTE